MIDIHTHVLPGVTNDDGVSSYEEALELIQQGYANGLTAIVATPHVQGYIPDGYEEELKTKQGILQQLLDDAGINVRVCIGAEILCDPVATSLVKERFLTLNETGKYVLVEFPMMAIPSGADELLFQIQLQGVTPIIAHPERNGTIQQNPNRLYEFVSRGILAQLTAGSLIGYAGTQVKYLSKKLLQHNLIHIIASDAHHPRRRPLILAEAKATVADILGEEDAQKLFVTHPQAVIDGHSFRANDPERISTSVTAVLKDAVHLIFNRG